MIAGYDMFFFFDWQHKGKVRRFLLGETETATDKLLKLKGSHKQCLTTSFNCFTIKTEAWKMELRRVLISLD